MLFAQCIAVSSSVSAARISGNGVTTTNYHIRAVCEEAHGTDRSGSPIHLPLPTSFQVAFP
jgi:hypothetical protein